MPEPKPAPPKTASPEWADRVLVGALTALIVARLIIPGDDPGRLRLTSGTGPVSFNLLVFLVLLATAAVRLAVPRVVSPRVLLVALSLLGVGVAAYWSSQREGRYARPGYFIAWEWFALAAAFMATWWIATTAADRQRLIRVIVATTVMSGVLALYQSAGPAIGLPTTEAVIPADNAKLVGDEEFSPELNNPNGPRMPGGTFDSPATLLVMIVLTIPLAVALARAGHRTMAIVVILLGLPVLVVPKLQTSQWAPAIGLIRSHPLDGVGPGNFARAAPHVLTPGNAWLSLAATTGIPAMLLLGTALAAAQGRRRNRVDEVDGPSPAAPFRWEVYLGGTLGLTLGFFWSIDALAPEAPPSEVLRLGMVALARAGLWIAAMAVLESARPTGKAVRGAVQLGTLFVLALAFVTDAAFSPTVLFAMFVALGLTASPDPRRTSPQRARLIAAAVGLAAATALVTYWVTAADPAWRTASAVRQARLASRHVADQQFQIERAKTRAERATAVAKARDYLISGVVNPLIAAAERDPGNATLWLEIAEWERPLWRHELVLNPEAAPGVAEEIRKAGERAIRLDPLHPAGNRSQFESYLMFRRKYVTKSLDRVTKLDSLIEAIAERDPTLEVPLRYRVVSMLLDIGDTAALPAEVTTLLQRNRVADAPHGRLTEVQRQDVIQRAKALLVNPPRELLEEWVR